MMKFMLIMLVKMFMSFVGLTLTEDVEVFNCDEEAFAAEHESHDMEEPIFEKEFELSEEEEFILSGYECTCGDEYYMFGYDSEDYYFVMFADHNGQVLYYSIEYYE